MKIPVYFKETSSRVFFILQLDSRELAVNRGLVEEIVGKSVTEDKLNFKF